MSKWDRPASGGLVEECAELGGINANAAAPSATRLFRAVLQARALEASLQGVNAGRSTASGLVDLEAWQANWSTSTLSRCILHHVQRHIPFSGSTVEQVHGSDLASSFQSSSRRKTERCPV